MGVLAAKVYKQQQGQLRVLEAMSASGVRSLRYYLESDADFVWINEGNYELNSLLKQNIEKVISDRFYQLTHWDAHRVFFDCFNRRDYYDLVDVDCFGTAAPYLNTMLWATKIGGLMYLTSTDGRTLAGRTPNKSLQAYAAYPRSHPALQEQALRLIIGSVAQQAATKGLGIEPVFALFWGETYRLMFRLTRYPNLTSENYGFLGYCHQCGDYQTIDWRKLGKITCPCDRPNLAVSGAMWLGALHDREYLSLMKTFAEGLQWHKIVKLLRVMIAEADLPPYFFTLREIGKRGKLDLPQRSLILEELQTRGYSASETHINPEAIKTNANINTCISIAKKISTQRSKN